MLIQVIVALSFTIPVTAFIVVLGLCKMQSERLEYEERKIIALSNKELFTLIEKLQKDHEETKKQVNSLMLKVGFKL